MAYVLAVSTLDDIYENVSFSSTVSIISTANPLADPPEDADPPITSIVVTPGSAEYGSNVSVSVSGSSFTISGKYADNFSNDIYYLDNKSVSQLVHKFKDVPADFTVVYKLVASPTASTVATYGVTVNSNNIGTVSQTIKNNYSVGRDALIDLVAKGKY